MIEAMQDDIKSRDMTSRQELATKGDIQELRMEIQKLRNEIVDAKHEILKWMVTGMIAQTALLAGIIAFLR